MQFFGKNGFPINDFGNDGFNKNLLQSRQGECEMKKAALAVLFLILFSSAFAEVKRFQVPIADSPQLGPANAPVTIIEFLDFQ